MKMHVVFRRDIHLFQKGCHMRGLKSTRLDRKGVWVVAQRFFLFRIVVLILASANQALMYQVMAN